MLLFVLHMVYFFTLFCILYAQWSYFCYQRNHCVKLLWKLFLSIANTSSLFSPFQPTFLFPFSYSDF
ncbi:hypothetical protein BDZ91DRAFT_717066 [Kalaharituber pfeilii]|nr:hypothetical protein BDZ91DRAFT_717066 [Kalaharituber pfeilii]